jgi:hypothetical protein
VRRGIVVLIATGPLCGECMSLRKCCPSYATTALFIQAYKDMRAVRDLVEAARAVLRGTAENKIELPSSVCCTKSACRRPLFVCAYFVWAQHLEFAYRPKRFRPRVWLLEFGTSFPPNLESLLFGIGHSLCVGACSVRDVSANCQLGLIRA